MFYLFHKEGDWYSVMDLHFSVCACVHVCACMSACTNGISTLLHLIRGDITIGAVPRCVDQGAVSSSSHQAL